MEIVVNGAVAFRRQVFPQHQELFETLANGQWPEVLFITCADSRIDPNMVTQTKPGDLFIIRNAGNIVPPHTRNAGGVTASIEYAVAVLGVQHIVICGHTKCGAMHGAINPAAIADLEHVKAWLDHTRAAVEVVKQRCETLGPEHLRALTDQNVLVQLQHLRTHPTVAAGLAARRLELHGWVYEIETGEVFCHDEAAGQFIPLAERYSTLIKEAPAAAAAASK